MNRVSQTVLVAFVSLLVASTAEAQRRKEYLVELGTAKPLDVSGFYFSAVEDARSAGEVIGSAQVGMNNRRVQARLAEPLEFAGFRTVNMLVRPRKSATPLTLRITDIHVGEHTTFSSERGFASVAGEVIYVAPDSTRIVLYRSEAAEEKGGLDVTGSLGRLVVESMRSLIREFARTDWQTAIESGGVGVVTAPTYRGDTTAGFPYHAVPDEALYVKARDFASDTRSDQPFKVVQRGSGPGASYAIKAERGSRPPRVFAATYKGVLYLSATVANGGYAGKRQLLRSEFVGPYAYFTIAKTNVAAGAAFGLAGAAASTKVLGVALDTRSGVVHVLDKLTLAALTEDHQDLRDLIKHNRRYDPRGSREIIAALNERAAVGE